MRQDILGDPLPLEGGCTVTTTSQSMSQRYIRPALEAEKYEKVKVELDSETTGCVKILTRPVTGLSFAIDIMR
jgi:hypothetical protein